MKLIDVSVPIDATLATYPGHAPFELHALTTRRGVTAEDLAAFDLREDLRLLLKTHNSTFWGDPAFHDDYVGVTENGASYLADHGGKVVGVDYLSVDTFNAPGSPAHHILLGAGTIVIEGLNLRDVEPGTYDVFCLPLAIVGADGAPARVVLRRS